jgi:hypothetical protein
MESKETKEEQKRILELLRKANGIWNVSLDYYPCSVYYIDTITHNGTKAIGISGCYSIWDKWKDTWKTTIPSLNPKKYNVKVGDVIVVFYSWSHKDLVKAVEILKL